MANQNHSFLCREYKYEQICCVKYVLSFKEEGVEGLITYRLRAVPIVATPQSGLGILHGIKLKSFLDWLVFHLVRHVQTAAEQCHHLVNTNRTGIKTFHPRNATEYTFLLTIVVDDIIVRFCRDFR